MNGKEDVVLNDYHQLIANAVSEHARELGRLIDYIEIGVLTGNSAKAVLGTGKVRYAALIDNFSNTHCGEVRSSARVVAKNLQAYAELFKIFEGDSRNVMPKITDEFDVGFVDGEHTDRACWNDMENMLRVLREDGIMFVDDLDMNGFTLRPTVERFAFEHQLNMTYHSVHNGLGELRR